MKMTVFGATGGTGTQVVVQALDAGHEVLAVVRDRSRLAVPGHPNLEVAVADVMDPGSITGAVTGRDAVVSAIGPRTPPREPTTVCADSARSIVTAMQTAGSRRLLVVSGSGPFTEGDSPLLRYVAKPIAQRVLRHTFADFVAMEAVVKESGLDWTIVRPPRLTDKPVTGRYRTRRELNVRRGLLVSRADVAHLILAISDDPGTYHTAIFIAK
ncbi:MAG: NAD(P)-dependent oxidoreductase [Micromonosporaceae bacterium]